MTKRKLDMVTFFRAVTPQSTHLSVDLPTRWMFHAAPADRRSRETGLLAFRPSARSRLAVMMADDELPDLIYPPLGLRAVTVFRVATDPLSDRISFLNPLTHRSLQACVVDEHGHGGINEDTPTSEGRFAQELVPEIFARASIRICAEAFEALFEHPDLTDGLFAGLRAYPPEIARQVFSAMLPLMTLSDISRVSEELLADPALLARLSQALPDDPWINYGLFGLAHRRKRDVLPLRQPGLRPPGRIASFFRSNHDVPAVVLPAAVKEGVVSEDLDHLATWGYRGQFVSMGHACNAMARSMTRPGKRACVVATARNEGLNILEWVAYHRGLGFDDIFIYSNNNDDGSDALLSALDAAHIIHWIDNRVAPGGFAQPKAYGHALGLNPDTVDYAWMLVIDLDEFLVLDTTQFGSINDFLKWQEVRAVDAIALSWVMIGSDDDPRRQDGLLTRRFRRALAGADRPIKTIFRPQIFIHAGPHFPHTHERRSFTFLNAVGDPHRWDRQTEWKDAAALSEFPTMANACVFHYFFKSADEFLWKFARNRGDYALTPGLSMTALDAHFIHSFVGQTQMEGVLLEDRAVLSSPHLQASLSELLNLPRVRDARDAIIANYDERIGEVRALFREAPALAEAGEAGEILLRLIETDRA